MLKKFVASLVVGGALLGGIATVGSAYASTSSPAAATATAAVAPTGKQQLHAWFRDHRREIRRDGVALSATTIGVSTPALVAELRTGTSIADVAAQHNVSAQSVISAGTAAIDAQVQRAVKAGTLTSTQGNRIAAHVQAYVTKAVDRRR